MKSDAIPLIPCSSVPTPHTNHKQRVVIHQPIQPLFETLTSALSRASSLGSNARDVRVLMCVVPCVLRVYGQTGLFLETGSMQPTSGILACAGRAIGTASDRFDGADWFTRGILKGARTVLNVIG